MSGLEYFVLSISYKRSKILDKLLISEQGNQSSLIISELNILAIKTNGNSRLC